RPAVRPSAWCPGARPASPGGVRGAQQAPHPAAPVPVDPGVPATARRPVRQIQGILPGASNDVIALTIDDGPDPRWTPQMLDLLRLYGIQATFSLIGTQARAHPAMVRRIIAEGHALCNHSMTHPQ